MVVGEDAVVPDAAEAWREDVQTEAAQSTEYCAAKLQRGQLHGFALGTVAVIFVVKSYFAPAEVDYPVVRDGRLVGISAEVFHDGVGIAKRRFGLDNSLLAVAPPSPGYDLLSLGHGVYRVLTPIGSWVKLARTTPLRPLKPSHISVASRYRKYCRPLAVLAGSTGPV